MLAGLTQSSTLVARAGPLDLDRLGTIVDLVQTTSPSALIFASLDASRRQMALDGRTLLERTLTLARRMRATLADIDGLEALSAEIVANRPGANFDPTRVIVDVHQLAYGRAMSCLIEQKIEIFQSARGARLDRARRYCMNPDPLGPKFECEIPHCRFQRGFHGTHDRVGWNHLVGAVIAHGDERAAFAHQRRRESGHSDE